MTYNWNKSVVKAQRLIQKFGRPAKLRRNGHDRDCIVCESQFSPADDVGKIIAPVAREYIVSTFGLAQTPSEKDALVLLNDDGTDKEVLRMTAPPGRLSPGPTVVYWTLRVQS